VYRKHKRLGILGGLGPESTVDYYKMLVDRFRERTGDGHYPSFVVNSMDLKPAVDAVTAGDLAGLARQLVEGIDVLVRAGATFGLIAANTPHIVFDDVQKASSLPLISIMGAARDAAIAGGHHRVALFGTRFTMQATFYPEAFASSGVAIVVPDATDQDWIHEKYFGELLLGVVKDETRDGLLAIVDRLREREGIDGLLIAGTELSLILRQDAHGDVVFLDTAKLHVERALDEMLSAPGDA